MKYVSGQDRGQSTLFPVALEELVPELHACRVIEAFVDGLDLVELGFSNARLGRTGRPPYDPGDLLKLYLYGYLNQIRSSRRLERECQRNVELLWLLHKLAPDHKTIASFRRDNREALVRVGAELVRLLRGVGLIQSKWVAVDGSKFQAVASRKSVVSPASLERLQATLERRMAEYLAQLDAADEQDTDPDFDADKVRAALDALARRHADAKKRAEELKSQRRSHAVESEPEARLMRKVGPGYNVQIAVEESSGIIVAHAVTPEATDNRQLKPMAEAAAAVLGEDGLHVMADCGYSNGAHAAALEAQGIVVHAPANRTGNHGGLLDRREFIHDAHRDVMRCPGGHDLKPVGKPKNYLQTYCARRQDCAGCPLKSGCTTSASRSVTRHIHGDALQRMHEHATPEAMRRRRCTVEHPFAGLKYQILGHPRLLMRGLAGAVAEMAISTMVWNLKRAMSALGAGNLRMQLAG